MKLYYGPRARRRLGIRHKNGSPRQAKTPITYQGRKGRVTKRKS